MLPRIAMVSRLLMDAPAPEGDDVTLSTIVVLGQPWRIAPMRSAPAGAKTVAIEVSDDVVLTDADGRRITTGTTIELSPDVLLDLDGRTVSAAMDSGRVTMTFGSGRRTLGRIVVEVAFVALDFLCDADRDGRLDETPTSPEWTWGERGRGPILLVNNDRDVTRRAGPRRDRLDSRSGGPLDLEDMAPLAIVGDGPQNLSPRYRLVLQVSDAAAEKIRIFDCTGAIPRVLIEPGKSRASLPYLKGQRDLRAEGLQYPDMGFTGFVTVDLLLTEDDEPIAASRIIFRVAPWIMPSNLQRPRRVFMCEMRGENANDAALAVVERAAEAVKAEFVKVPPLEHRSDRWIQDELEIGYSSAPGKTLGVVLDSPRDRGLDSYPERLIAPDFGWVTRGDDAAERNSLESFGNLEVSPPVTVDGRAYPLGRIIFGGAHPTGNGRRMMKVVSDFLYAQQVQSPIELYSDWLAVGHVDEFMSFVPANDALGFRLLLASPDAAWKVLRNAQVAGHGQVPWLVGKTRPDGPADVTIDEVLADDRLRKANEKYQRYIDWNRGVLVAELGLAARQVIDLPALFFPEPSGAAAYFPDVVNLLVLEKTVIIPKPFGPEPSGTCIIEKEIQRLLRPIGLTCLFVDTWYSYHILSGEIHCGTNAYREPLATPWWEHQPGAASIVEPPSTTRCRTARRAPRSRRSARGRG